MLNPYWSKRHRPPCNRIFEGVLVLKWDAVGDFNDGRKRHSVACEGERALEGKLLLPEQSFQFIVKLASEDDAEYLLGEEEPGTRGPHPGVTTGSKAPGGHDAMQVGMMAPTPTVP